MLCSTTGLSRPKHLICSLRTASRVDVQSIITPTQALTGHQNKRSWAMAHSPPSQNNLSLLPGFLPFLSVTICGAITSESDKGCHHASLSPASGGTPLRRQHLYQIWQFLKLCLEPRGRWRRKSRWLRWSLFANKITGRHSPQGTIWQPHLPARNSPPTIGGLFIDSLTSGHPLIHTCLVKRRKNAGEKCSKLMNLLAAINHRADRCHPVPLTVSCP